MKFTLVSPMYVEAIKWIALNDAPADKDEREELCRYLTVQLLAHMYNVESDTVAGDVIKAREAFGD